MQKTLYSLLTAAIGLTGFVSCDSNENRELSKGKIDDIEVRLIQKMKKCDFDEYVLEIYNSKGDLKAKLEYYKSPQGFIHYNDKKIDIRNIGVVITDKKPSN